MSLAALSPAGVQTRVDFRHCGGDRGCGRDVCRRCRCRSNFLKFEFPVKRAAPRLQVRPPARPTPSVMRTVAESTASHLACSPARLHMSRVTRAGILNWRLHAPKLLLRKGNGHATHASIITARHAELCRDITNGWRMARIR